MDEFLASLGEQLPCEGMESEEFNTVARRALKCLEPSLYAFITQDSTHLKMLRESCLREEEKADKPRDRICETYSSPQPENQSGRPYKDFTFSV